MRGLLFWRKKKKHNAWCNACWKPPGGTCDPSWQRKGAWRNSVRGEGRGGLLAYSFWVSSGGRWEGRRAGRRRWTQCPLAASGAFRSPPLTETGSSSETEGNWCLWTFARRRAKLAWGTLPFPRGSSDAKLHCLGFYLFIYLFAIVVRQPLGGSTVISCWELPALLLSAKNRMKKRKQSCGCM